MSYKITIPQPCSENWNKMNPTQKGAFCKSCQKEVIDFTHTNPYTLSKKLERAENICDRFKPEHLNIPLPSISRNQWKRNTIALGFTSLLAISAPLAAQENSIKQIHIMETLLTVMGGLVKEPIPNELITITGNIHDMGALGLPGASIIIKGTKIGTQADFDGNFTLSLNNFYRDSEITLIITYIGFKTIEKSINLNTDFVQLTLIELEEDIMGELVITRKQNIFRRIGNLFRKNN